MFPKFQANTISYKMIESVFFVLLRVLSDEETSQVGGGFWIVPGEIGINDWLAALQCDLHT